MNLKHVSGLAAAAFLLMPFPGSSQDSVTISKSRLKELEEKEAELERLKQGPRPQTPAAAATNAGAVSKVERPVADAHATPAPDSLAAPVVPIASLPPLKDRELVSAADLATYYRQDRAAADKRFRNRRIVVEGEIAGFNKPLLKRNYRVLLAGAQRDSQVVCDLIPPDRFSAVFTTGDGLQLVGLEGETRVPILKTGERILVEGVCRSVHGTGVLVEGREFKKAPTSARF